MIRVESAEGLSWKKGLRYLFHSVRPTLFFRKKRQKLLITFRAKGVGDALFVARFDVQGKPCRRVDFGHVFVGRFACGHPERPLVASRQRAPGRSNPAQHLAKIAIQTGFG